MKYAVVFTVGAVALTLLAAWLGGVAWIFLWPAVNLIILAWSYHHNNPELLGKDPTGRISKRATLVFLPYFGLTWLCYAAYVRLSRERWADEVADGIWVGRRPDADHLPPEGALVVDLTAEFPASPTVLKDWPYICVPVLDARAPALAHFEGLIGRLLTSQRPLYIHCAQGHGRSATVAARLLIERGLAQDSSTAESLMQQSRPGIRLHRVQRRVVDARPAYVTSGKRPR